MLKNPATPLGSVVNRFGPFLDALGSGESGNYPLLTRGDGSDVSTGLAVPQ
jgi:hypothetical protein